MKIIVTVLILILLAIFLPVYNGIVHCGINPDKSCFNEKLNLIEYIKYKNRPVLLKDCPDEMILNKMSPVDDATKPKLPPSYYVKDGVRREIQEYDSEWLRVNCTIPVQEVYSQPQSQLPSITNVELQQGWYYGSENQKKPGTPATWVNTGGNTRSEQWYDPVKRSGTRAN